MGKKGGDADVYQSPHFSTADDLGFQTILGMLTGQGIAPSPQMSSSIVAEQLGGKYNNDNGTIKMPDGSTVKFDPVSNSFIELGGKKAPSAGGNGGNRGGSGNDVILDSGAGNPYLTKANETLSGLNSNVYDNPNSAYNTFNALGNMTYDPSSGQYIDATKGAPDSNLSADYYFKNYGQYLDNPYKQADPYQASTYNQFDYKSPTIGNVDNVSDAARANIYQRGADRIASTYRDTAQNTEDFINKNGSTLSSGRAARLKANDLTNTDRQITELQRGTDTEHELRNYDEAKHVRDLQANQDMDVQKLQGEESRYGQDFNKGENQYAYTNNRDEGRYGYEQGQAQGKEKMGIAEGINTSNRSNAFQELQANRQQNANKMTALLDMLRVYGGQDSTAAQLAAAQSQAMGSALGGLFGAVSAFK